MDIFQLAGDFLHFLAMLLLLLRILVNRNVVGIINFILGLSYKTQQLYLIVFLTRYVNLVMGFKIFYIFIMKIVFITITIYTMYLMRYKKPFKLSYDKDSDSFQHYFIYLAALLMSVIIHKSFNPIDFLWSFSIWLEAFAILPQLNMIIKLKDVENITAYYIFFLGLYRIFYIIHW